MWSVTREFMAALTGSSSYLERGPEDITCCIERVRQEDAATQLIIGDSVCAQMFNGLDAYNEDFAIVGSNAALTVVGQYVLVEKFLEHHSEATDVYLIMLPESLSRTIDQSLGYSYVIMPLIETGTMDLLDEDTIERMKDAFGAPFFHPLLVRAMDASGMNRKIYYNYLRDYTDGVILETPLELADRYVVKMSELCEKRGVSFHFYPGPVCESKQAQMETLRSAYGSSVLHLVAPDYFDRVKYYPAEWTDDQTHFSGEYANQDVYNEMIRENYAGEKILKDLKLENK